MSTNIYATFRDSVSCKVCRTCWKDVVGDIKNYMVDGAELLGIEFEVSSEVSRSVDPCHSGNLLMIKKYETECSYEQRKSVLKGLHK